MGLKMASTRPGNHDKAWNDPPLFSFDASKSSPAQDKKVLLNKRIAFPLSGNESISKSETHSNGGKPPIQPNSTPPLTIPRVPPSSNSSVPSKQTGDEKTESLDSLQSSRDEGDHFTDTLKIFEYLLCKCENNLQKKTAEEVARRLDCLKESWRENKLEDVVKKRMHNLSSALACGDYEQANNIHLELIVNHAGQVSPWMVGIKHLIHQSKILGLRMENTST